MTMRITPDRTTEQTKRIVARVSGEDFSGDHHTLLGVGDAVELPELDHHDFRVASVRDGVATLVQEPGHGEEWLVCPSCSNDDLDQMDLRETYSAYRSLELQDGTLYASGFTTDDGEGDYVVVCRCCTHEWDLNTDAVTLEFD